MKICFIAIAACAAVVWTSVLPAPALAQIITSELAFPKGATRTTVASSIEGYQTRDYAVRARAGQLMSVSLNGSTNAYFNVLPPGSDNEALHNSSLQGNEFAGTLALSGAYRIRVYQMRAAARRGKVAPFRLTVSVTGRGDESNVSGDRIR